MAEDRKSKQYTTNIQRLSAAVSASWAGSMTDENSEPDDEKFAE